MGAVLHSLTFALCSHVMARFDLGCSCETATSSPWVKKILERPSENCIPHPNRSFFLREFLVTRRCAAALGFPLLLVDEKEPTIHGDCLTVYFEKYLPRLTYTPCVVSEQSNFRSLALPQYLPRIKYGGNSWFLGGGSKRFWGVCLSKQASPISTFSYPDKNRKK